MASPVSSLFHFYILACLAITRGDYHCGTQGTYKKNSAYEKNLNYTLSTLTESLRRDGFFKTDSDSNSGHDTAYALALCQGNIEDDRCRGCVHSAADRLRKDCPNQKEATAWHWGTCMLSYSNTTFDIVDDKDVIPFKTNRFSNSWDSVLNTLQSLFGQLGGKAASGGYNTDNVTVYSGGSGVYIEAKMQCIPDISRQKCDECLMKATSYLLNCCHGSGQLVVFYQYSCLLSYSVSRPSIFFVNNSVPPATPSLVLVPPLMAPTIPSTNLPPPPGKKSSNFIAPAVAAAAVTLAISTIFVFIKIRRTCSKKGEEEEEELFAESDDDTGDMIYFRLNVIHSATSNFSVANKLGEGGFGPVYRGELPDGKMIAVKRLSLNSSQGLQEFKTEVKLIIKLQHKNLVRLLGCCMKRSERLLVYEYMSNSSLDKYLFDPKKAKELDWAKRVNIVSGIAKGLRYLHEDSRLRIIHRDLKASNVLLDEDMNPKISDFGTARIFGSNQMEANTDRVVGTYGYMAPEYAMEGIFSIKSDVYSFGVLLLEIISGKRNGRSFHQEHDQNLLCYAWMLWEEGKGEQLIDENLNDECRVEEALKWMRIALLCVEEDPNDRPAMSSVTYMLEGEWKTLSEPKPPMFFEQIITSDQSSSTWIGGDDIEFFSSNETLQKEDS